MTDREDDYEVYHCGWTFVTAEFKVPCQFPLSRLRTPDPDNPPSGAYFAVLHNKQLCLYESDQQRTVFGEIPLRESQVELWPRADLYNDEVYARELPIAVTRNKRTLFVYASSASEKEDWFLALRRAAGTAIAPYDSEAERHRRQQYFTMAAQQQQDSGHLAWLNALVARLLFNRVQCAGIVAEMKVKFLRRLALAPIPFFVGGVELKHVSLGNCPPVVTSGQHHYTNQSGETMVSVSVCYSPPVADAVTIVLKTIVKLDTAMTGLWQVPVTLTVKVVELTGTLQLWLKPPPSDRLWFAFATPPTVQVQVDTDSVSLNAVKPVLRAAVQRVVQEAIRDSFLVPYYSDSPVPPCQVGMVVLKEPPYMATSRQPGDLCMACGVDRSVDTPERVTLRSMSHKK